MSDSSSSQTPEQPKVAWGPLAAVGMSIAIYFLSQLLVGIVLSLLPWSEAQRDAWLESVTGEFVATVLIEGTALYLLWLFLKGRRARLRDLGLVSPRQRDAWEAVKAYTFYFVLLIIIMQLVSQFAPGINLDQEQEIGFSRAATGLALAPIFVSLVLLPPLVEEILFRGFLYTGLRRKLPFVTAAIITSSLFAVAHLQLGTNDAPLWAAALDTFVLSLILVRLREKTGSLWPCIGVHMFKNATAFAVLFVFRA
jgi:hypothetical protein